jgi:hypothetical protein
VMHITKPLAPRALQTLRENSSISRSNLPKSVMTMPRPTSRLSPQIAYRQKFLNLSGASSV